MMRSARLGVVLVAMLPLAAIHGSAQADHESEIVQVTPENSPQQWDGDTATGSNINYDFDTGEPCVEDQASVDEYCDIRLLHVSVPEDFWDEQTGGVEVRLDDYRPNPSSDFDLQIFESDEHGTRGGLVASSGNPPSQAEQAIVKEPSGYYLMQIVYFAVTQSTYTGTAELFFRDRVPPDVDDPPGVQEVLASDPGQGWTSRSEMHVAQNPVDPNLLVASSKFYNRDPDALAEYEFKLGSYASFDRGASWVDLGQINTCPRAEAPPESWPDNTCYPRDNPNQEGTGDEDAGASVVTVNEAPDGADVIQGEQIEGTHFPGTPERSVGPAPVFLPDDGEGCIWETAESSGEDPWIGLARRGGAVCSPFQAKFAAAEAHGADGLVIIDADDDTSDAEDVGAQATIPALLIGNTDGDALEASVDQDDPDALQVTLERLRGPDFGEEYIVSDPWVQWDDEGNAYAMALDAPPFESGLGWGMSLHRWVSVSAEDVQQGRTWSNRIPINRYGNDLTRDELGLLDDKNTFAVNNAGPDGDGQTGIMVACWGQNVSAAVKQQIVCERSTDGGRTWPEEPRPISDVEQLVIGVHVVADTQNPQTFYATWLQYTTTVAGLEATMEFAVSQDGGQTWVHRQAPAATLDDVPRQFPRQSFRNLSIPIMAVGPDSELYITYAEYVDASDPENDLDDKEADIRLIKSTNGGVSWSAPATVNAVQESPNPNADQFQPYVEVTKSGQVNLIYFDRRLDMPRSEGGLELHPGNFFTDVFLARSNDGGQTFSEVRLTHDATDPEFNAPVSGSGLFFGDYQGLAADDCGAIPFVNDTHLANDEFLDPGPVRDPGFDDGLPSSPYQEAVSWQVPNTAPFGGPGPELPEGCGDDVVIECPNVEGVTGRHFVGTPDNDVIEGTNGRDVICGRGGNDTLVGRGGNDLILGGDGDDTLVGGEGRDRLRGQNGNDVHRGGAGEDDLGDLVGNNTFKGGPGDDDLQGGGGADRFVAGPGDDDARARGGRDFAAGGAGNDDLRGGGGQDDLRGYRGHDGLRGGRGSDSLKGGQGNDFLSGARGTDVCRGGPGTNAYRGCEERL